MAKKKASPPAEELDDDAPVWEAITAACQRLYPDQTDPPHVAPVLSPVFGDDLIYGISAYRAAEPVPHWHLVTYGFSELYAKESDDPAVSGWGFELTFRLAHGQKEKQPPNWAFNFLMNLGKYVRQSHNPFDAGHLMDLNGPIALGTDTAIRAIAFVLDPQLSTIDTPNGRVEFLQIVGLTRDEHEACGEWNAGAVLDLLRASDPLLVTDLDRRSVLDAPAVAARVEAGIARDGSASAMNFVSVAEWATSGRGKAKTATVTLGARGVQSLLPKFRSRLAHGRPFALIGPAQSVDFRPADQSGWAKDGSELAVTLTPAALAAVRATLKPVRGRYEWPELPGFVLDVQPSNVTDADGNVIEVIG